MNNNYNNQQKEYKTFCYFLQDYRYIIVVALP